MAVVLQLRRVCGRHMGPQQHGLPRRARPRLTAAPASGQARGGEWGLDTNHSTNACSSPGRG